METLHLIETPIADHRLGRHVRHDPRSWGFPAPMAPELHTIFHKRHVPIFNQKSLGSCTGQSAVGCISTGPFTHKGTELEAVNIYSEATHIDSILGYYPPKDTGSTGLAVMKVLKQKGLIKSYTHAFSLSAALRALCLGPGITGIMWRTGCDKPDRNGLIRYQGAIRGGHELVLSGIDVENRLVWLDNSWGAGWGKQGSCCMGFVDYGKALEERGDASFPGALP